MYATKAPHRDASAAVLNKARRQSDLNRLREEVSKGDIPDLLVVGAGITGAGIALDAASRGLKTVIVDAHDLAFGTSRWSSKLAHGGLRYLATGNVGIARRSAIERGTLLDVTAPHLVHNLPQVVPVMNVFAPLTRILPRMGFLAGDFLRIIAGTSATTLPLSRTVGRNRVAQLSPTVRKRDVKFGYVNYDGQLRDDARLVTAITRTAASYGATVLTRVRCENANGTGATLIDELTGESFELPARAVVNATGVWAADLATNIKIRPSRGTHLVLDAEKLGNPTGSLTVPVPGYTNRFCFVLPAEHNRVYIGLTDEDAPGPIPDVPEVPEEDITFLLDVINQALETPLTRDDVAGAFAGLRPLIDAGEGNTADLSREHALLEAPNGLISITGGKLTEYRLMAEQAVDKVVEKLGVHTAPCSTRTIPVLGSEPEALDRARTAAAAGRIPMPLFNRYGGESFEVIESCKLDRPLDPVAEGLDVTRAEFAWHVTHEGALSVDDILDRRTRLGMVEADRKAAMPAAEEALKLA
ncbi:MAG: glycerol-3-phosphate dehydrogenase/oxidase [Corynebacterium sp.]|uniref:glycerol-3-phosphate dehydrogenase/oxidase n=1 Tax=Corynebacterium sp. TaxID=1720 RepID=UPI0026DC22C1|nr:glycerol-3-phosphate dehydrogenase/oxidase [Corynebacterium sp.]MDO5029785.1 glycerol-3-phosphate dehydrogenase/oxidase [Corynebacterium sp.]